MAIPAQTPDRRLSATGAHLLPDMKPPGTRGKILQAALLHFAESGYAGSSMRDIAAACDIRAATVYSHYPSKGHLLAELCELGHAEHGRLLRSALLAAGHAPSDQISALVRAHVQLHTGYPMLAVVANAELHHLPEALSPRIFELRNQSIQLMSEVISRGVGLKAFSVPDLWLATAAIGGMGLRVAYWFDPDGDVSAESVADGYVEFALRLLNAKPDSKGDAS
ncbi:MAG: TetR/AcrR family transcriptional regulator [Oceanococcus sp.]